MFGYVCESTFQVFMSHKSDQLSTLSSQAEQMDQHKSSGVGYRAGERKQKPRKAPQLTTDMFNFSSGK